MLAHMSDQKDPPEKRLTLLQLAKHLGMHHTTVSRALREHPEIAESTRQRVRQLAKEMGYRPDPYLTALAAYRRTGKTAGFTGTLGWITNWPDRDGWRSHAIFSQYFEGARTAAERLGYRLEEFWLGKSGVNINRTLRIIYARGIQGIFFMAQPECHTHIEMDLSQFSAVTFGYTLEFPQLHGVSSHPYRTMMVLLENLQRLGYRRPGLFTLYANEERLDRVWSAANWAHTGDRGRRKTVPPLIQPQFDKEEFFNWLRKHRPDVIIASKVKLTLRWLQEAGLRVPQDIGLASPVMSGNDNGDYAGMDENGLVIGAAAVDLLVSMLHRNERGIPAHAQRVLIDAIWVDGQSVRKQ